MTGSIADAVRGLRLPIPTPRLLLDAPERDRDAALIELLADRTVSRWTTIPHPYGPQDARAFRLRAGRTRRAGTDLALQVVRRSDRALLGGVGLHGISGARRRAELGYWIGRPFRRQGFTREAVRAVLDLGFGPLGLHRIEAHVLRGNRASEALLRSAGFRREGLLRESWPSGGTFRDELVYGRLADRSRRSGPAPSRGRSASPTRTR